MTNSLQFWPLRIGIAIKSSSIAQPGAWCSESHSRCYQRGWKASKEWKNRPSSSVQFRLYQEWSWQYSSNFYHGHITIYLPLATLVPIIKNKLASINTSKNYRSIAISSLILKILDWIILTLFGQTLGLDELQFAYQQESSTSMCTWAVMDWVFSAEWFRSFHMSDWYDQGVWFGSALSALPEAPSRRSLQNLSQNPYCHL